MEDRELIELIQKGVDENNKLYKENHELLLKIREEWHMHRVLESNRIEGLEKDHAMYKEIITKDRYYFDHMLAETKRAIDELPELKATLKAHVDPENKNPHPAVGKTRPSLIQVIATCLLIIGSTAAIIGSVNPLKQDIARVQNELDNHILTTTSQGNGGNK